MTSVEAGFLLLTSHLGDPGRRPLTAAQLRTLSERMGNMPHPEEDRELRQEDLTALGYGADMASRIVALLDQTDLLEYCLQRGKKLGCVPISRVSGRYPAVLRNRLGADAPGCLWAKGDLSLLNTPAIALVGSRELHADNRVFAAEAGRQAALQGYTLISGNARGADRTAQEACLRHGGRVICVTADELSKRSERKRVLYLSEDDFEEPFSAQRALSRNRVIHALAEKTLVAQSGLRTGGTWDGTVKNLRFGWSPVCCFRDGSEAAGLLEQMGAEAICIEQLSDLRSFGDRERTIFEM